MKETSWHYVKPVTARSLPEMVIAGLPGRGGQISTADGRTTGRESRANYREIKKGYSPRNQVFRVFKLKKEVA